MTPDGVAALPLVCELCREEVARVTFAGVRSREGRWIRLMLCAACFDAVAAAGGGTITPLLELASAARAAGDASGRTIAAMVDRIVAHLGRAP